MAGAAKRAGGGGGGAKAAGGARRCQAGPLARVALAAAAQPSLSPPRAWRGAPRIRLTPPALPSCAQRARPRESARLAGTTQVSVLAPHKRLHSACSGRHTPRLLSTRTSRRREPGFAHLRRPTLFPACATRADWDAAGVLGLLHEAFGLAVLHGRGRAACPPHESARRDGHRVRAAACLGF